MTRALARAAKGAPPRKSGSLRVVEARDATPFLPERRTLTTLRKACPACRGCELYRNATQAVFGEGQARARVVLVGEQPGDSEDREGRPFLGPAGQVLDRALEEGLVADLGLVARHI